MEQKQKKNGRKRGIAAAGMLLVAGVLVTSAAFTDFANINLNGGTAGSGIGPGADNAFALMVAATNPDGSPKVDGSGNVADADWVRANTAAGIDYLLTGIDELAPGSGTATVTIPLKNNSKGTMLTSITIEPQDGKTSDTTLLNALRFDVIQNGVTIASGKTVANIGDVQLSTLDGKATSKVTVVVSIADLGAVANNTLADKTAYVTAHIDASSN